MNLFEISGLLIGITSIIVVFVVSKGKTTLHKVWAFFNLSLSVWGLGGFFVAHETNPNTALVLWRIAHVGVIFIPITFFHFVCCFTHKKFRIILPALYILGFYLLFLDLFTSEVISRVEYSFNSFYYAKAENLIYVAFFIFWMAIVFLGHVLLIFHYKESTSIIEKNKIKYFFLSVITGFAGGVMNFFPIIGWNIYPYGNILIPIYCIIVTYAILRFRLLDITIAITRTGIFILVYSLVLGIPFAIAFGWNYQLYAIFGDKWWLVPLVTSTVLATGGPFIYLFIQKRAEDKLFQDQRRYQSTLRNASAGMSRVKDLNKLLKLIVHIVTRTVRIEHGAIYMYDRTKKEYRLMAARNSKILKQCRAFQKDTAFIRYLRRQMDALVFEEVDQRARDYNDRLLTEIREQMKILNSAIIIPSLVEQEELIAFLVLGKKKSGELYSSDDIAVFSILSNQAALAIENAQFYEEAKRTQQQLFQAEKMATIGTMADGLSHQINNRLHALGFIAGDALDTIKLKLNNNLPAETSRTVEEVKNSLSRILDNVKQGGEIVEGLLKYSRKGEAGFEAVDLNELFKSSIEMVQYKIKLNRFDLIKDFPETLPKISGNFTQLQEVLFNLIDNAYDALMQRKEELGEKDYKPHIHSTAQKLEGRMNILITDNGMGVRDEEKEKLFTPFFTTKLSSKKGTGLGLYVIRKIIEENHGGEVKVVTRYRAGTTFSIFLPIIAESIEGRAEETTRV